MTLAIAQSLAAALACFLLWSVWKGMRERDRMLATIVGAGIVVRAAVALAAFWVSWLRLPLLRSLQLGEGLWFYALDGRKYFNMAGRTLADGLSGFEVLDLYFTAHPFVHTLAIFRWLFGPIASVALLLNLAAHLATCWMIVSLASGRSAATRGAAGVTLLLMAFAPGPVLWWSQPLKDVFFSMVVIGWVAAFAFLVEAFREERVRGGSVAFAVASLLAASWTVGGIRPYFATILWVGALPPFILFVARSRRRGAAALLSILLLLAVSEAAIAGGGRHMRAISIAVMAPWRSGPPGRVGRAMSVGEAVEFSRGAFESTGGGTQISRGDLTEALMQRFPVVRSVPALFLPLRGVAGMAIFSVPRFVARPAFVNVGGGRGLWIHPELDTLWFDASVAVALAFLLFARRGLLTDPPLLLLVVAIVGLWLPMTYVVRNFGTLYRLRGMVELLVLLVPLFAMRALEDREAPEAKGR